MADPKKLKGSPMTMEAFRAKKAGAVSSTSNQKTTTNESRTSTTKTTSSATQESRSRPQTASKSKAPRSRSASVDSLNTSAISIEARQDKVKKIRDKQTEDKKKKNEERRTAFEERKKKKDEEERKKWESLKQQAAMQRPGSGRKLPTVPDGPKRPATGSATRPTPAPARPTGLPKSLKATSTSKTKTQGTAINDARSPVQSSSSQSSDSSPKHSPTTHGKSLLSAKKQGSNSNLSVENRRASTSNINKQSPMSKSRPLSVHGVEPKIPLSKSHNSLSTKTHTVKKAQSTSALHHIGIEKPLHNKKHAEKPEKPKAGLLDEAAAKQALAERRKQAREEAERKAKLDLERQEEERKKKEEEEKRIAEEMAKEEERMRVLAELLKQQNEEKMKLAAEEKEKREKEEAERLAEEEKQREEERKIKEEEERIAKIEAEKKALEDEQRRKKEEIERQERRRRVEEIMSRTRQAKTESPNTELTETTSTAPPDIKELDVEDTKRKVSEILQKVKDRTELVSPVTSVDGEQSSTVNMAHNVENQQTEGIGIDQGENSGMEELSDKEQLSDKEEMENPKPIQEVLGVASGNDSVIKVRVRISETRTEVNVNERGLQRTISHEHDSKSEHSIMNNTNIGRTDCDFPDGEESIGNQDDKTTDLTAPINGYKEREYTDVRQDNIENKEQTQCIARNTLISADDESLWKNTEFLMQKSENSTSEKLENAGICAEGDNNEQSEEETFWKVIEGSVVTLSEVA